jgi:hypothetical protein
VVTWTRDSAHTHGNAVDVVVDGSWDNPAGFARLQRIAREEGLRTLGMRDPGHLELAADSAGIRTVTAPAVSAPAATGMAQVAGVAGVAGTAATAGVAQVAAPGVGTPGIGAPTLMAANREALQATAARTAPPARAQGMPPAAQQAALETSVTTSDVAASVATATSATAPATPTPNAAPQGGAPAPRADLGQGGSSRDRGSDRRDDRQLADAEALAASGTAGGSATDATPRVTPMDQAPATVAAPRMVEAAPSAPSRVSELAPGAAQASRVAELQDQREAAPAAPLSRMTLAVEGAQGGEDRITVDLRGTAVDAHIATDAISAERLRQRAVELQDALGRHGLDAELLRVSSNAAGGDAGTGGQREPRTREEARREQQGPRDEPRTRDQQDESRRGRRNPYQERAG